MRLVSLACALMAGCASPAPQTASLGPGEVLSARAAQNALVPGKSTRAEVRAALGAGTVIDFESGYEVWVYREKLRDKAAAPATELVLLFDASGVLAKTRVR